MLATNYSTFILLKTTINNNRLFSLSVCSSVHTVIVGKGKEHIENLSSHIIKVAGKEEQKDKSPKKRVSNF